MPQPNQPLSSVYRVALVTGASSGLGRAIARALLDEGLKVYGTTRDIGRTDLDPDVDWLAFEGSDKSSVADWIRENSLILEFVDILINNCGAGQFGDIASLESSHVEQNLQLLLTTPIRLTKAALGTMRGRKGIIVNISSLAAQFPLPYMASYTSAKAGLSAFTQSLMLTETSPGIALVDFQPGDFRTAFNRNMGKAASLTEKESRTWDQLDKLLGSAPSPEIGAKDLLQALRRGKSCIVRSGGFFQTRIAPLGIRFLPRKWLLASIRRYYHLKAK